VSEEPFYDAGPAALLRKQEAGPSNKERPSEPIGWEFIAGAIKLTYRRVGGKL